MTTASTSSGFFDWAFRRREDGQVVLAQLPNPPILLWGGLMAARVLLRPKGELKATLDAAADGAFLVWGMVEAGTGVNPFRRAMGGLGLVGLVLARRR